MSKDHENLGIEGRHRIIVVDDDLGLNKLVQRSLQSEGYDTIGAYKGREAIELALTEDNPFLVLDYRLPDMRGTDVVEKLRKAGHEVPFIVITGFGDEKIAVEMMKLGAMEYIIKDSNFIEVLPQIMKKVIEKLDLEARLERTEGDLHESVVKYRDLFDKSMDGIIISDIEGRILDANPKAAEMLGYRKEELMDLDIPRIHPESALEISLGAKETILKDGTARFEIDFKRKDGSLITAEVSANMFDLGREMVIQGIMRDVTERKRSEETIRKAKEEWEVSFDSMSNGISLHGADNTIINVNRTLAGILGKERDEIIGKKCYEIFHGTDEPIEGCPLDSCLESREPCYVEVFEPSVDKYLGISTSPIFRSDGELQHVVHTVTDITERMSAAKELKESEERLQSIFKVAPVGIGLVRNRIIIQVNDRMVEMLGYAREELEGKNARIVYLSDEEYEFVGKEKYDQITKKGTGTVETKWKTKDGSVLDILLSSTPLDSEDLDKGVTFTALDITERKRSREALITSERKFRTIAEDSIEGIAISTIEEVKYANPAFESLFGYSVEELNDLSPEKRIERTHPDDFDRTTEYYKKVVSGEGALPSIEYRIIRSDGSERWVESRMTQIVYEDRPATLSVLTDITERKKAEEALRESELKYRTLFDDALEMIHIIDIKGMIIDANERELELMGYPKEEYIGKRLIEMVHPDHRDRTSENLGMVLHGKTIHGFETVMITKEGEEIQVEVNAVPQFKDGNVVAARGILRDITEKKEAQNAIVKEMDRAQRYLDTAGVMFIALDDKGRISLINRKGCDILGFKEEEVIGSNWFERFVPERIRGEITEVYEKLMAGDVDVVEYFENPVITASGEERQLAWHNTVTVDDQGNINGTLSSGEDITDRKTLEQQLLQSQKLEGIGRLAGGVAHDFNNQLTVIINYCDLVLMQLGETDPLRQKVQQIKKAADSSASLTRQLLAFSRKQILRPQVLNINDLVRDMELMFRRIVGENIELRTSLESDIKAVKVDRGQLEQIIMNLVVNAKDAMPDGGVLDIRTEEDWIDEAYARIHADATPGEHICLTVSDTGSGMDRETQRRIFEPFFTTKGVDKGTGLGLAVAYGIVSQHNGWISVYSEPGKGTVFKVYLPAVAASERPTEKETYSFEEHMGKGERILMVEDEATIIDVVSRILADNGYDAVYAGSVQEATEIFGDEGNTFDLIFSDVVLPDGSGLDMIEIFLMKRPDIKILMSSGYTEEDGSITEIKSKNFAFLQKPYVLSQLLGKIREVLEE